MSQSNNGNLPTLKTLSSSLRVLFIHGGGWKINTNLSEQPFAKYLQSHFSQTHVENMTNTGLFEQCIRQQTAAIIQFKPHLIVCKSQGGPTLLQLLHRGIWRGPSVLCCPAIVPGIDDVSLVSDVPFLIVSGSKDIAVPLSHIDYIMQSNQAFVDNGTVQKCIVEDDHGLLTLLNDEQCKENNLYRQIERCWSMYLSMDENERRSVDKFTTAEIPKYDQNTENNTDWFREQSKSKAITSKDDDDTGRSCSCRVL